MVNTFCLKAFTVLTVILVLIKFSPAFGQGCSDAGFCTIGSFKHETQTPESKKKSSQRVSLFSPIGQGDAGVIVWTPALQYDYFTSTGWSLQGKITSNYATGNLGTYFGVGDIFLTASKSKALKNGWNLFYTLGTKIPLNQANASEDGMPLPMQYQSSLGTFDAIAGLTIGNAVWQFSAGYQQPITGENKNGFLPEFWNGKPEANNYPPSFNLLRKPDMLLRASRNFSMSPNFDFNAGLLGIFHLGEDQYTHPFEGNQKVAITGSSGLTLNATATAFWKLNEKTRIGLTGGVPLAVREVRPDGLTRSWILVPELNISF